MFRKQERQGAFRVKYGLDIPGFKEWLFCPGMLFRAAGKWWGDRGARDRPHEGLDLLLYKDRQDRLRYLNESIRIPVMMDGVIVGIINDFLGKSIIVEHRLPDRDRGLTIYGHTLPCNGIHPGMAVRQGDDIATVAGPGRCSFPMAPHVHISIARMPEPVSCDWLNWDTIGASGVLTLLDPLDLIDWPYRILANDDPACRSFFLGNHQSR